MYSVSPKCFACSVFVVLPTHLGAIGELVGSQIDLAKAALAYEPSEGVVADCLEVCRRELTAEHVSVSSSEKGRECDAARGGLTRGAACTSLRAGSDVSTMDVMGWDGRCLFTFFLWAWISACPLRFDCMDCAQEMSRSGEAS